MSIYIVNEKFQYTLTTSSVEYIKNYNFSDATVTTIPATISNIDSGSTNIPAIPITVNITTSDPWLEILDPVTNTSLKYPSANVVLQPISSKQILVRFNLPPDIDVLSSASLEPKIIFDLQSGSRPISTTTTNGGVSNIIVGPDTITMYVNDIQTIGVQVFGQNGELQPNVALDWKIDDVNIVDFTEEEQQQIGAYQTREMRGLSTGSAVLRVSDNAGRNKFINITVASLSDGPAT